MTGPTHADVAHVQCDCDAVIPVTFTFALIRITDDGDALFSASPDLTDVWAHAWTHGVTQ